MASAADVTMDTACCSICYEDCTGRRKAASCCYCKIDTCNECVKSYILQSFQDAHCHSCKRGWSDEFLGTIFTKTVINTVLKKHRQAIWLERQRALLPTRQALVENERHIRKYDAIIKELSGPCEELTAKLVKANEEEYDCSMTRIFLTQTKAVGACLSKPKETCTWDTVAENVLSCKLCSRFSCAKCGFISSYFRVGSRIMPHLCMGHPLDLERPEQDVGRLNAEHQRLQEVCKKMNTERSAIRLKLDDARYQKYYGRGGGNVAAAAAEAKKPKTAFVRACPSGDCRGFLSSAWKCGTCEGWACSNCHEYIGKDKNKTVHVCHPDQIASARMLEKETKPCPKCASAIFKISGCFAADTPILMWNGSVKMSQDIVKGDRLVGDDGLPRSVLKTLRGEDDMYEVKQSGGASYKVNQYHTLALKDGTAKVVELTVKEFVSLAPEQREKLKGFKSTAGIQYEPSDDPSDDNLSDPYALGVSIANQVSTFSIPGAYMRGKRDTRLKVLAGMVDFHAHVRDNQITFALLSLSKAQQVALLGRSLGFTVDLCESDDNIIVKMFGSGLSKLPTRHALTVSAEVGRASKLTVTPLGRGSYYGWEVDANHRFLLPEFTVVRNCDQMWCTVCNSGFSWRDGKPIDTRAIHNPHFFEYMSRNNMQQQTGDAVQNLCMDGNIPPIHSVIQACIRVRTPEPVLQSVARSLRFLLHVQGICMRRYQRLAGRDSVQSEEELAVLYLMNDISEKVWMERLQRAEKRQRKYRMFSDIFESYVAACTDVFRCMSVPSYMPAHVTPEVAVTHCTELWSIASNAMSAVCKLYDCKMPRIDFDERGLLMMTDFF